VTAGDNKYWATLDRVALFGCPWRDNHMAETKSTLGWIVKWLIMAVICIILYKLGIGILIAFIIGFAIGSTTR
jgi:hypothetical protein